MGGLGAPELLIILAVVVLLFGGAKLPQLARSLGQAQKEFRSAQDEEEEERKAVEGRPNDAGTGPSGPTPPPPA